MPLRLSSAVLATALWAAPSLGPRAALGVGAEPQDDRGAIEIAVAEPTGRPVAAAEVTLSPQGLRAETDGGGRASFHAVLAGPSHLIVSRIGYRTTVLDVEVVPSDTVTASVVLEIEPVTLAELVAAGRAGAVGRSVVEFDRERLAARSGRSVGELLAEAGVGHVTSRGSPGWGQTLSLRGARPEGVLVLLDGVPLNDPVTGVADLSLVPVESLERVEVVPGAGGVLYGPGAVGGVVNLRRRASGPGGFTTAGLGSHAWWTAGAGVALEVPGGTLGARVRTSGVENDYAYTFRVHPDRPTLTRRNADATDHSLGIGWVSAGRAVEVSGDLTDTERGIPGPMGTTVFDQARLEVRRGDLGLRAALGGWTLTLRGAGFRHRYHDARNPTSDGSVQTWTLDGTALRGLRLGPLRGTWLIAARGDWAEGSTLTGSPSRGVGAAGVSLENPASWGVLSLGLRADALHPGGLHLSPHLAVLARGPRLEAHGRVSQGVRAPTFADLYFASPIPALRPPDLEAERVLVDLEGGVRWHPADVLDLTATAYYRDLRDAIVWAPTSFVGWRPQNVRRVVARGVEAALALEPGPWSLGARYEWADPRLDLPLNRSRLPYIPEHQLTVHASVTGPASARMTLRHLGRRTAGLSGAIRMPPVTLVDAGASVPVRSGAARATVAFDLLNVFGTEYELVPLYPMPGREIRVTTQLRWGREEER